MRSQFDMKLKVYGYRHCDKSQLSRENVVETKELIKGLELPDTSKISDISINPRNISKQSKIIINNLFPNLNRDIDIISMNEYFQMGLSLQAGKISMEEYLFELQKRSFKGDAVNVPIAFSEKHHCTIGETVKPLVLIDSDSYLERLPIYVSGYNLGSIKQSRLSVVTHLHEVTHALLERNKGSVTDYYKSEMLSILMEKIAALEIDQTSVLLSKQNIFRYENLKESLNKNADDDSHKYLLSTLLAEVLFDKYENGTEAYKHHLLAQISNVLSGKLILEKMLENEGIILDNANLPCFIDEKIQKSIKNIK